MSDLNREYLDFLSRVTPSVLPIESGTRYDKGLLIHDSCGVRFAISSARRHGALIAAIADPSLYDGFDGYPDDTVVPGAFSLPDTEPASPDEVNRVYEESRDNRCLSVLSRAGELYCRSTFFTFEGGIAVLGHIFGFIYENGTEMPTFRVGVLRSFAAADKMKVHKNTTTHGGFIVRTLMEDLLPVRHIRPITPDGKETRNVFTMSLTTGQAGACFAYEITKNGMGFGCQMLSNNETCQAILLSDGDILSFNPFTSKLTRF